MRRLPVPSGPDVVAAAVLAYMAWLTTPAAASWLPGFAATPVWVVVVAVSGAAVLVRSRAPQASMVAIVVVLLVHLVAFSQLSILALAVSAIAAWTTQSRLVSPWRWGLLAAGYVAVVVSLVRVLPQLDPETRTPLTPFIALVTGWSFLTMFALAGAARRRARERVEQAIERAEILQAQQDTERRLAVSQERARIARDVHDLLGHSLAVIGMQAAGAQAVLRADPGAAEEALTVIGDTARRSVEEVRALIDVLHEGSPEARSPQAQGTTTPGPDVPASVTEAAAPETTTPSTQTSPVRDAAGTAGAQRGPASPGLDAVPALVSTFRSAGLDVALDLRISSAVPEAAGQVLHDVTREALTNVVRHAPGSRAHVKARASNDALEVSVVNTTVAAPAGPTHPHGSTAPAGPTRPHDDTSRRGYGLESMRARVDAVGGRLSVGPTEAGWQVLALVPGEPEPADEAAGCLCVGEPAVPGEPAPGEEAKP